VRSSVLTLFCLRRLRAHRLQKNRQPPSTFFSDVQPSSRLRDRRLSVLIYIAFVSSCCSSSCIEGGDAMLAARVELRRWAATRSERRAWGCDVDPRKKQLEPCFLMMAHRARHDAGQRRDAGCERGAATQSGDTMWAASVGLRRRSKGDGPS
jgi:hypothetical protein